MKKFLLVLGFVATVGFSNALATSATVPIGAATPVLSLGSSGMTANFPDGVYTQLFSPASNTGGIYIRTISTSLGAGTQLFLQAATTTPTNNLSGRMVYVAYSPDGASFNSNTEYYIPAGMGVWVNPYGGGVFASISWDTTP